MSRQMDEWTYGRTDGWVYNRQIQRETYRCKDRYIDVQTNGWMDRWMQKQNKQIWMNVLMDEETGRSKDIRTNREMDVKTDR